MAALTEARLAVWQAIDNYAPLANVFRQKLRWDKEQAMLEQVEPSISDLPCISIRSGRVDPEWFTHQQQHLAYLLIIEIWTADWIQEPAEDLFEKTMDALYRSRPGSSGPTYLEPYMPFQVMPSGPIQGHLLSDSEDGGTQVMLSTIQFSPNIRKNPFGNS